MFASNCTSNSDRSTITSIADYTESHLLDVQSAADLLLGRASNCLRANASSLAQILQQKRVYHLPNLVVPQRLKAKKSTTGAGINIGKTTGIVQHELGRGAYGVVALLETTEDTMIAVKAQSPTGCLSWEYRVLEMLVERMKGQCQLFFPRPLSFMSLSDGALLSMTAGSKSGLNLVDLSNVYSNLRTFFC